MDTGNMQGKFGEVWI